MITQINKVSERSQEDWLLVHGPSNTMFVSTDTPNQQNIVEAGIQIENPQLFLKLDYKQKVGILNYRGINVQKAPEPYVMQVDEYNKD